MVEHGERVAHQGQLWRWTGGNGGSWHFVAIDGAAAGELSATALVRRLEGFGKRGFGSIRVVARIGDSMWETSVFPQKDGTWLLPVKAAVRRAEDLVEGDLLELELAF